MWYQKFRRRLWCVYSGFESVRCRVMLFRWRRRANSLALAAQVVARHMLIAGLVSGGSVVLLGGSKGGGGGSILGGGGLVY